MQKKIISMIPLEAEQWMIDIQAAYDMGGSDIRAAGMAYIKSFFKEVKRCNQ